MNQPIEQLVSLFKQFPGIGLRQAKRFVYFLLQQNPQFIDNLTHQLQQARNSMKQCAESYQFFNDEHSGEMLAPIVRNPERTKTKLMIVIKDLDLEHIEAMHIYDGQYFVLGNLVPMITDNVERFVRVEPLLKLIKKRAKENELSEIIFSTPANPEGEHTRTYIQEKIRGLAGEYGISITTLGRGLSTGSELEYVDPETFREALGGRK